MTLAIGGDRYEILAEIGSGGMGTVYHGLDRQTEQSVAIKHLRPEIAGTEIIERFKREGEALRQLNHPNIVKVLDTIEQDGQYYIILEYVPGGDLHKLLQTGVLPIKRILNITLDLADALTRAHRLNIIHRDFKPANVLIAEDGTPRLSDFGLALMEQKERVTQTGLATGTVDYMSPEALMGVEIDSRADIWSFGVMLFEMLAGCRPFRGDLTVQILLSIMSSSVPDLEALRPDCPVALVDLVYRMLTKDREQRVSSVRLIGAELEAISQGTSQGAKTSSPSPSPSVKRDPAEVPIRDEAAPIEVTPHSLPLQTTPFVGRESELIELAKLLDNPTIRLATILGPGGMGKTRLSLEYALQHTAYFSGGVCLVELAPLSSPEHIVAAIADVMGVQFAQGSEPKQQLLNSFHDKKLLLIMDNFEHLLDGAPLVHEILQAAPNIKILVTSRERLNLSGEAVFILSGMNLPDWETPEAAFEYGAVKLFIQSAKRAKLDFELAPDDLKFLVRICRLVTGMPLAIVLTAAWVSMLSLEEIAGEVARSLDFLETDMQDIPARQRSIRGVFDYSYNRLPAEEQRVFRGLAVFRGGATREAAQAITGASLKTLMALMNKSLLRRDQDGRYQFHELLRQYGEQMLVNEGEVRNIQEAHATFFAHFLQQRWDDLKGRRQVGALADIDSEYENIRVAWQWLVENQRLSELGAAASSLWFYFDLSTRYYEGAELFEQAIDNLRSLADTSSEKWVIGHLLGRLAWFQGGIGLFEKSKDAARQALNILENADRPEEMVMALASIGQTYDNTLQFTDVRKVGEEAIRIAQESNNEWAMRSIIPSRVGGLYFSGDIAAARRIWEEGLALSLSAGDLFVAAYCCNSLAFDARGQLKFEEAESFSRQGLQLFEMLHNSAGISESCIHLGASLAQQGKELEAKPYFHRGIKIRYDAGVIRITLIVILTSVEAYFTRVDKTFAVELLAMILKNPACDEVISGWTEKTITLLTAELPSEIYETAWRRGSLWTLDQAVADVLAQLS